MSAKDLKLFKLKARGAAGAGKTEMLIAFGRIAGSFGMITALSADGHDMLITSTKAQRCALYAANRMGAERDAGGFLVVDSCGFGREFSTVDDLVAALIEEGTPA